MASTKSVGTGACIAMQGVRPDFLSQGISALSADEGPSRKGQGLQARLVLISEWRRPRDVSHCRSALSFVNCNKYQHLVVVYYVMKYYCVRHDRGSCSDQNNKSDCIIRSVV
jgi:hypothetical protein